MKVKKVVITGDLGIINRHQFLFEAMSSYWESVEIISWNESFKMKTSVFLKKFSTFLLTQTRYNYDDFHKSGQAFILKSEQVGSKIKSLSYTPDLVFHLFCLWTPFWHKSDIPYIMLLDYTMSLAERTWLPWATFNNQKERDFWMACERQAYERAYHLFCMSHLVKSSLVRDYGIGPEKITVTGSSGTYKEPYNGEKLLGTKQILFNGSDFERKGGDTVLAAFKQVKQVIPQARLVIIGKKIDTQDDGIDNPGFVSALEVENLFLKTDLVVAPAHCDPFPHFLIEAMNYGVPCIVSGNDGMPEIIDNEVNGIVINQPTPELLAEQIIRLLGDRSLLEAMSIKARAKVQTKFNWSNIAENISLTLSN